jgi:KUP system potassium uptake protein
VFSSTFTSAPSYEDLVQVLSIVIWSLTLVVTIKYVFIVLRADNEGEGGTFSCYSLLTRFVRPSAVYPCVYRPPLC